MNMTKISTFKPFHSATHVDCSFAFHLFDLSSLFKIFNQCNASLIGITSYQGIFPQSRAVRRTFSNLMATVPFPISKHEALMVILL